MGKRDAEFQSLHDKAHAAGMAAGEAAVPAVMHLVERENPFDDSSRVVQRYVEPEGPCGFAWINIRPGNSPFAIWAKKQGRPGRPDWELARKSYYGGVDIWVSEFGQSMQRKEAYARAYAEVLREAGIKAHSMSRMD
jgi:hypothetical protein